MEVAIVDEDKRRRESVFPSLPSLGNMCKKDTFLNLPGREVVQVRWFMQDPENYGQLRDGGLLSVYIRPGTLRMEKWTIIYEDGTKDKNITEVLEPDSLDEESRDKLEKRGFIVQDETRVHPLEIHRIINALRTRWLLGQSPFKFDFASEPSIHCSERGAVLIQARVQQLAYAETVNVTGATPGGGGAPGGPMGYQTHREAREAAAGALRDGLAGVEQQMEDNSQRLAAVATLIVRHTDESTREIKDQLTDTINKQGQQVDRQIRAADQRAQDTIQTELDAIREETQILLGARDEDQKEQMGQLQEVIGTVASVLTKGLEQSKTSSEALGESLKQALDHVQANSGAITDLQETTKSIATVLVALSDEVRISRLRQKLQELSVQAKRLERLRDALAKGSDPWIEANESIDAIVGRGNALYAELQVLVKKE